MPAVITFVVMFPGTPVGVMDVSAAECAAMRINTKTSGIAMMPMKYSDAKVYVGYKDRQATGHLIVQRTTRGSVAEIAAFVSL
jgi:hypothetical protein